MTTRKRLNPDDYSLPEGMKKMEPGQLESASQDPELRKLIRIFARQIDDASSAFLKSGETAEDKKFLNKCRRDSKKFRHVLQRVIQALSKATDDPNIEFIMESLFCTNKALAEDFGYHFSVEIRPLLFSSVRAEGEKVPANRYPHGVDETDTKYTVFLHIDSNHKLQIVRFSQPDKSFGVYAQMMNIILKPFKSEKFKDLLEEHYGEWEYIAKQLTEMMVTAIKTT